MEQIGENLEGIEKTIAELFPDAKVALTYGSTGEDHIQGVSDIDILIIGPWDSKVEEKLKVLHEQREDLDPIYLSEEDLAKSNFKGKEVSRDYELHRFDLYRVKNQGRVLFGDAKILELFPVVTLDEALLDTLPHIKDIFIPRLREKADKLSEVNQFLAENLDTMLVVARAIYSIETKEYGSKMTALEYLKGKHAEFADLFERMGEMYLKQLVPDKQIQAEDIRAFLDFAERTISEYL